MRHALFVAVFIIVVFAGLGIMVRPVSAQSSSRMPTANTITLSTSPVSLTLEVNSTPLTTPYSFPCDAGTSRTMNAPSPQVIGLVRYRFANWSDGGGQSHVISCDMSGNYTAFFLTEYGLRLDTIPSGLILEVDSAPGVTRFVSWCSPGSTHFVFAPSPQGFNGTQFLFTNWGDGGQQGHTVACDSSRDLVAFYVTAYTTLIITDPVFGVVIEVDSFQRLTPYQFPCVSRLNHFISVPSPQTVSGEQWSFSRWTDSGPNPRSIACDRPTTYTAIFERVVGTGPPLLSEGLLIASVIVTIIALAIFIPVVVVKWIHRAPASQGPPPPSPSPAAGTFAPARPCPRCGARAEADWAYCMRCGEALD